MTFNSSSACHAIKPCLGIRKASIYKHPPRVYGNNFFYLCFFIKIYIVLHLHLALRNFNLLKFYKYNFL